MEDAEAGYHRRGKGNGYGPCHRIPGAGKKGGYDHVGSGSAPDDTPCLGSGSNLIPNLVYAANGSEVQLSMVDGRIIMEDRILLSIDEKKIIREAQQEGRKLLERAGHKLLEKNSMIQKLKKENKL